MPIVEIDGKEIEVEAGSMIIEAADALGVYIPRFCYHKELSIAANCRMCLVEVDPSIKPLPACATPVADGMKVFTKSQEAIKSQKAVMEFLLINHPLDYPICDQGGECELQDLAMGFGSDFSRYKEGKRSVQDKNLGSLIATDMTRCIHCTRCVRFGEEIAGCRELGATGRGEHMEIGTYIEEGLKSELSGNVIDICPVGALTSKPFRFTARAWELEQYESVAPHDCVGSNIYVHALRGKVMRVVPKENNAINQTWISDRDRFSYSGLASENRLHAPCVKRNGSWEEISWEIAFDPLATELMGIINNDSPDQVGGLISPSATIEEQYLFQKVLRSLGCNNIDHRIHQSDFSSQENMPVFPGLGITLDELEEQSVILLIGSNVTQEQPIVNLRMRKAVLKGAKVVCVNPIDFDFNYSIDQKFILPPTQLDVCLAEIAKALLNLSNEKPSKDFSALLSGVTETSAAHRSAKILHGTKKGIVILGELAINHPQSARLYALGQLIAHLANIDIGFLTHGANAAGAWLAGCVPHRGPGGVRDEAPGLDVQSMFQSKLKSYFIYGLEPNVDCANPLAAQQALKKADFVVAMSSYTSAFLSEHAHLILPITPFTEMSGTYVNLEGKWQSFEEVVKPYAQSKPGWKIFRMLGEFLHLPEFDFSDLKEVRDELKAQIVGATQAELGKQWGCPAKLNGYPRGLVRVADWPIYSIDMLARRSQPLQQSDTCTPPLIRINAKLAKKLKLKEGLKALAQQGGQSVELPIMVDQRVPDETVWLSSGCNEVENLSDLFGSIEILKES